MTLTPDYFIGTWSDSGDQRRFTLTTNGSAITHFGESEQYPGTWRFIAPDKLVVRAVIPLNIPDVDDELNAEEMIFMIKRFSDDAFSAERFDYEGSCTFERAKG